MKPVFMIKVLPGFATRAAKQREYITVGPGREAGSPPC
jgi:hypothetical protein